MARVPEHITSLPYLKQIRIQDHAPLRDINTFFEPGLNIIIGPNGIGKTRFLSLTSQLVNRFGTPKIGAGCELTLGFDYDIKVSFQQTSIDDEVISEFETDGIFSLETKVSYRDKTSTSDDGLFEALWDVGLKSSLYDVVLAQHGTPLHHLPLVDSSANLVFGKSFAMRIEPETDSADFINWPLLTRATLGTIRISFAERRRYQRVNKITNSLLAEEVRTEVERVISSYLEVLNSFLSVYSPIEKIQLSNTYQIYDNTAQQEIIVKGLVLEYLIAGTWLPFEALSDGTKRILYLISQLVLPTATFDSRVAPPMPFSFSNPPRIIFLEEPELGVHHAQLHKLLQLIREVARENQVILTTHAPQVLDMLGADELDRITVCSLDPEKGTQFHKLTEEKQEQARVYMKEVGFLSDYWRYSYLEESEAE